MTAITNVVVALMIVSGGEEPVEAIPYEPPVINKQQPSPLALGGVMPCELSESQREIERIIADSGITWAWGKPETLYRKTCTTNWVYATDVPVRCIWDTCHEEGCGATCRVKPEDIIGSKLLSIFFDLKEPLACDKHRTEGRK